MAQKGTRLESAPPPPHPSCPPPTSSFHQRPERSEISARLEAFLWGLGAAAAAPTQPLKPQRDAEAECLYGSLTCAESVSTETD